MIGSPPARAVRVLVRALRDDPARDAILGDLHEDFVRRARERGAAAARRWYWREALGLAASRTLRTFLFTVRQAAMAGMAEDVVQAVRGLRRNRGFALIAACVIALGVGATTAVFSVVRPLVLSPLPFPDSDRLVWISNVPESGVGLSSDRSLSATTSRSGNLRDFRERNRTLTGLTGYNAFSDSRAYTLALAGSPPERLTGMAVAHDFLDVLGVTPLLGRSFTEEEGRWGAGPVVVLTHGFWQRRFAADPGIVGTSIVLNGEPAAVIGVLPPTFDFASVFRPGMRVDFLLPFPISEETHAWGNTTAMIGRLRPGVGAASAQADLDRMIAELQAEQPNRWGLAAEVSPLQAHIAAPLRPALALLAAAAATVLLIVCVNVSGLLLARAPARMQEVAVRRALGASRVRLVRQLLAESALIALLGAVLGGAFAWLAIRFVASANAIAVPLLDRAAIDPVALLFGVAVALVAGFAAGIMPALRVSEGGEAGVLRSGGRGGTADRGSRRVREGLIVVEVALACVLLITGGLLLRSFRSVLDIDLGFDADGVVVWQLNPSRTFESPRERSAFLAGIARRVSELPGLEAAGLIDASPLGRTRSWGFSVVGVPEEDDTDDAMYPLMVDPGYVPAMRIGLVAGRNIDDRDDADAPPVVLINESGARHVFGDAEPLGQRIRLWDEREWEVVGVVRDAHQVSPEIEPGIQFYFPMVQLYDYSSMDLVVHSNEPVERVVARVSGALREIDPQMPAGEFWTQQSRVDRATSSRRFTIRLLAAYGAVALFLAALGIYGVLSHTVEERRPEIGIRMALGATAREILGRVVGRTLALAGAGVAFGLILSLWATRLVVSQLHGVDERDALTFATAIAVVTATAALAGLLPALRAARTPAMGVLRSD